MRCLTLSALALAFTPTTYAMTCDAPELPEADTTFESLVAGLHRQLDIPEDYGESRDLDLQSEAPRLVVAAVDQGQGVFLMSEPAADAWLHMQAAARVDGIELFPVSTYRSVLDQMDIISNRLDNGESIDRILTSSTAPGYSEHHTGDAIDLSTPDSRSLSPEFAETDAFDWLEEHAADYCFELSYSEDNHHGLDFEPWHWRFKRAQD